MKDKRPAAPGKGANAPRRQGRGMRVVSDADPLGSYTGNPKEPGEKPVQDADDL